MKNMIKLTTIASLLAFTAMPAAQAMKCGTHIISWGQGDSPGQYEVLKRCGEPTARQGNTWIYERSGATHKIRFDDDGNILDID